MMHLGPIHAHRQYMQYDQVRVLGQCLVGYNYGQIKSIVFWRLSDTEKGLESKHCRLLITSFVKDIEISGMLVTDLEG